MSPEEIVLKRWQEKFGLTNWVIRFEIDSKLKQNAKTIADPRYQRATITVHSDFEEIEWNRIIVHELIHIVMAMYDFYVDNSIDNSDIISVARENAVSQLGEIFLRNVR